MRKQKKLGGKAKNFGRNSWAFIKGLGNACIDSSKQLWNGDIAKVGFMKHSGKALISFAAITTTVLTANTIIRAKNMAKNTNIKTIDKNKESTVI
jgi:hypothetical protein